MTKDQRCPACLCLGAYIGFSNIECANLTCRYFSKRCHDELEKAWKEHQEKEQEELKKNLIYYNTSFYDFGDI